mmetsp:Transcript_14226/g.35698  ORF Transcript_14226/g.35698 Transcript_14226/m.35698 type:complete len:491 (-) Transcript_14226:85-1557(-)
MIRSIFPEYQRKRLAWGALTFVLVVLIVTLSAYFGTRPETIPVVETMAEETLPSLIKVAPIGTGVLLMEYTELLQDNSTVFYYLSIQDWNATTLEGVANPDDVALYLTRSSEPTLENLNPKVGNLRKRQLEANQVLRIGFLSNVTFPLKLPEFFLPGDYNGAILVEENQDIIAEISKASFSVLVDAEQNIGSPTGAPSAAPSQSPTASPTSTPSKSPTDIPSVAPSTSPSAMPSAFPTVTPPTNEPTNVPSQTPTIEPTALPSEEPSTSQPSISYEPSVRGATQSPTTSPSTNIPTLMPSRTPSSRPSTTPSKTPSTSPLVAPSYSPTKEPSKSPTAMPTIQPTQNPTKPPTAEPTVSPTKKSLTILTSELSGSYGIGGTVTMDYVQGFENGKVVDLPRLQFDIPNLSDAPGPYLYLSKRSYSETRRGNLDPQDVLISIDGGDDGQFNVRGRFDQFLTQVQDLKEYTNGSWIVWCRPFGVWIGGGEIFEA